MSDQCAGSNSGLREKSSQYKKVWNKRYNLRNNLNKMLQREKSPHCNVNQKVASEKLPMVG